MVSPPTSGDPRVSRHSYLTAVLLCAVFGIFGVHWFYIGRTRYGLFDLGLSIAGIALMVMGHPSIGGSLLFLDWIHSIVVTFRLLTGNVIDGEGRRIPYPGQKLGDIIRS